MAQRQYIKHLYENEERSLREIAKMTELSFKTVQKYAYMENWNEDHLPSLDPERYPVLKDYIPTINCWMDEDARQPRKQRHSAMRIHNRLQKEHQFGGSYASVKKYVRKRKFLAHQNTEGFLQLSQIMAHAQIDFGTFKYIDAFAHDQTGYALTISFPHSNKGFTQAFQAQNQECLLEGMQRIFQYIGGAPVRIKADNMTTAVAKILTAGKRELSDGFSRFMLHYRFQAEFCNPAKGNEKGHVENKVGYSRRNFFVPVPVIEDFDVFNEELFRLCEEDGERVHYKKKQTINELFMEEEHHLLALPHQKYQAFRYETARVNNYGYVPVDNNKYGLSPELIGKNVQLKIYYDRIEIFYEHSLLKVYDRSYKRSEEITDWKQYVSLLCRKPGAVEHTRFFNQLPKLWQSHLKSTEGSARKSALMLLMEIVTDNNVNMCDNVLEMAANCGRVDAQTMRQCYYSLSKKANMPAPLEFEFDAPVLNYNPDLSCYDSLTGGEPVA